MKNQHLTYIFELNIAMLFISTSGVLGRYIAMPPALTIWWRCLIAAILLGAYCWYTKVNFSISSKKDWKSYLLSAFFLGAHWVTYFYALHLSNVAIGMLSLFTYPIITVLLEPLFFKTTLNPKHLGLGILVLLGIYFLTPDLDFNNNHTKGVFFGLISSLFYALRNILTKKHLSKFNPSKVMFYQLTFILFMLWPAFFLVDYQPIATDWKILAVLAIATTAIGHTLFVRSFKNFTISTVSIMSSVQPIYGVLYGVLFLSEIPKGSTILGGLLILTTVVIESIQSKN